MSHIILPADTSTSAYFRNEHHNPRTPHRAPRTQLGAVDLVTERRAMDFEDAGLAGMRLAMARVELWTGAPVDLADVASPHTAALAQHIADAAYSTPRRNAEGGAAVAVAARRRVVCADPRMCDHTAGRARAARCTTQRPRGALCAGRAHMTHFDRYQWRAPLCGHGVVGGWEQYNARSAVGRAARSAYTGACATH